MRRMVVLVALALASCGGSAPPAKPAEHVAKVDVPESDPEPGDGAGTPEANRAPGRSGDDFAGCVASLRSASNLAVAGPDRQAYDEALGFERSGDAMNARKKYFELIQKYPQSKLIPLAYLAFGELFAAEAANDPSKWDLAKQAFNEVVKYPPPDNASYAYALLRLSMSSPADPVAALANSSKAAEAARAHPSSPCAAEVASQAREGMVHAYAEVGAPDKAWVFFRAKLGDQDGAQALRALTRLWRNSGKRSEACSAAKGSGMPDVQKEGCAP